MKDKRRNIAILVFVLISAVSVNAKDIIGKVTDLDGTPVGGIIVRLYINNKIKAFSTSDTNGVYKLSVDSLLFPSKIVLSSKNYSKKEFTLPEIESDGNTYEVPAIMLIPESYVLEEVVVKSPHARVKGDTITYDVSSYTSAGDSNIEDIIRKLPGVMVSETGQITYDGEPINNFYIEGLNLMGNNYMVATQNINPSDVSSISIYERHQSKRALQGIEDSQRAAINLKLKKGSMLKPVGYIEGGIGKDDELLWLGNLYIMLISPNNQTIVNVKGNDTGNVLKPYRNISGKPGDLFKNEPFGKPSLTNDRFLDNNSAYFTANTLFKLKDDLTFTVNSSYDIEKGNFEEESVIQYLNAGSDDIVYCESVDNGLKRHDLNFSAKIENNTKRLYLMDQFTFDGQFRNNGYDIFTGSDLSQSLKSESYSFSNDFSTIIRYGNRVVEIKSETGFLKTPSICMTSILPNGDTDWISQKISSYNFHNRESSRFTWDFNKRHFIGADVAFSMDIDGFSSYGKKNNENLTDNKLKGYEFIATVSPYYKFVCPSRLSVMLSLPISYNDKNYTDQLTHIKYHPIEFYTDAELTIFLKINQANKIDIQAGIRHDLGDIYSFAVNPIFTTFRNSTTLGNGELLHNLNRFANLSYSYIDPLNSFYIRGMVSFHNRKSNSLSVSDVSQSDIITSFLPRNATTNNLHANLTLTKRVRPWNTSISLSGTGVYITRETERNGNLINSRSKVYIVNGEIETEQFDGILRSELKAAYTINQQRFSGDIPSDNLSDFSLRWKLSVFPVRKLEIYGNFIYNYAQLSESSYKDNIFIDAGAKYSFKKFMMELAGRNLTNLKTYDYAIYHSLDIQRFTFRLRSLGILLTLKYNF